jgi:hypothetical protein
MEYIKRLHDIYPLCKNLLTPEWRKKNEDSGIDSTGFCYIAAEALYHMIKRGRDYNINRIKPCCATYVEDGQRCTHWWLQDKKLPMVKFDPTRSQYGNDEPPYIFGRGMGFQNGYEKPSLRAKELIQTYDIVHSGPNEYKKVDKALFKRSPWYRKQVLYEINNSWKQRYRSIRRSSPFHK